MKLASPFIAIAVFGLLFVAETVSALPAFPGAEGFGANALGGRGGDVIKVTNLDDSGPGSFREAVMTSGPRIVVFEVSGIIELSSDLRITSPFLTIAGETSPGGILITGRRTVLQTHDVIIRHLRFRVGPPRNGADGGTLDALVLYGKGSSHPPGVRNVIIDHCSLSWGTDEVFSTAYGATDFTVQWSVIAEGLDDGHPEGNHSKGAFFAGSSLEEDVRGSFHHNYIAHNRARNPEVQQNTSGSDYEVFIDIRNNVIYNFNGASVGKISGDAKVNLVDNYVKAGPESTANAFEWRHSASSTPRPTIYVYRNIGTTEDGSNPEAWNVASGFSTTETTSQEWRSLTPHPAAAVTTTAMSEAYALELLDTVGATKPVRDSVDTRIVDDFRNGTGRIPNTVNFPADYPVFASRSAPQDQDDDGMSDTWESENGFDPTRNDSAEDNDNDGYTNIEEYLHFLADSMTSGAPVTRPAPPTDLIAD
jgi:hypothetical protein